MSAAITVIVPTFNERDNIAELVHEIGAALDGRVAEVLFVDDSTDDTIEEIARVAASASLPVRGIHRDHNDGGLGGAVALGLREATHDVCIVMDGDLQHPPALLPELVARYERGELTSSLLRGISVVAIPPDSAPRCVSASRARPPG